MLNYYPHTPQPQQARFPRVSRDFPGFPSCRQLAAPAEPQQMATLTRVSGQGLGDAHSMRCPSLSRDQQLPSCAEMPLLQSMPSSDVWPELREKEQRKATGDSFLKEKYIRASNGIVEL